MPDDLFPPHLQQLYARRSQLLERLSRSRQEWDLTDDSKRKMSLERDQAEAEQVLHALEQDICQQGLREVRQRKLKRSYDKALLLAQHLLLDQPDHGELQQEVVELEKLEQQEALADSYAARLLRIVDDRFKVIRPKVMAALRTDTGRRYQILVQQVDDLLAKQVTAAEFCEWWQETRTEGAVSDFIADEKQGVAERVRQGKVALFLGSGVSGLGAQESELANQLAQLAQYDGFTGSLSSIAEYYRLKFNLGMDKLLARMDEILPNDSQQATLYQTLSQVPARLVLISSAYDDLLEQAFTLAGKPFARLSAMIRKGNKHEVGHVQVEFSDGNAAAGVYTSEQVSTLEKTLADYSIIYKMRGTCRSNGNVREALTVTESDYFSFAQNTAAILPNYLVAQLGDLGFLFVGYRPRHWEDRLLATVLLKRRRAPEPCFRLVQTGEEPLETVFWQRRSVQPYAMDVQELEQYLVGGMA